MSKCRIGFDIGGTFTDIILYDEQNAVYHSTKVHSTPPDQSKGAMIGIQKILDQTGKSGAEVNYLSHGTTVGTNAVLEGKLAKTALITTKGFRDVLEIARQRRPDQYNFFAVKDKVLIPRELRFEVGERVDYQGNVIVDLDFDRVMEVIEILKKKEVESVAVSFLLSFVNTEQERPVKKMINKALPDIYCFISSEILPEYREYERTSTVALNAAVAPIVSRYVHNLDSNITGNLGVTCGMNLMKSSGGLMPATLVHERAVETVLSGPAAGAIAISYFGKMAGYKNLIGFDIGGTSTDISVIVDGAPRITSEGSIGNYPFALPIVDINTIGAGGGSLAYVDIAGGIHVGPESAGATPGPVCYGMGGSKPTITDATLCMGRLNEHFFLGGKMELDKSAAANAINEQIAKPLGKTLEEASQGIFDVALANMVRAIRVSSVERGLDPRDFALIAFGGGGAVFTADVAEELQIGTVIIPQEAGLLSAKGLLITDHRNDYSMTRISILQDAKTSDIVETFAELKDRAHADFEKAGTSVDCINYLYSIDMRYVGQAYEINIPILGEIEGVSFDKLITDFNDMHKRLYWWSDKERKLEIVNLRISAVSAVSKPTDVTEELGDKDSSAAIKAIRPVYFKKYGDFHDTNIFDRTLLEPGNRIVGPAVIESFDTTAIILPNNIANIDGYRNIVITTGDNNDA